jgi:hypothetical protein
MLAATGSLLYHRPHRHQLQRDVHHSQRRTKGHTSCPRSHDSSLEGLSGGRARPEMAVGPSFQLGTDKGAGPVEWQRPAKLRTTNADGGRSVPHLPGSPLAVISISQSCRGGQAGWPPRDAHLGP